jgi:hypothetical protein
MGVHPPGTSRPITNTRVPVRVAAEGWNSVAFESEIEG